MSPQGDRWEEVGGGRNDGCVRDGQLFPSHEGWVSCLSEKQMESHDHGLFVLGGTL